MMKIDDTDKNRRYSTNEVASMLEVTPQTLYNWEKRGWLIPHHTLTKRFYLKEDLDNCQQKIKEQRYRRRV